MKRPTVPRDAASLVIVREPPGGSAEAGDIEVLMGRRPTRDRFMPDVWVFPGGRVDASDARVPLRSELPARELGRFAGRVSAQRARMLGVAAIRETHEETGLIVGDLEDDELRPDLSALELVARAITPSESQIRYHARFFLARAEQVKGSLRSNGELLDLAWLPIPRARALPIIDVTQHVLSEVEHRLTGNAFRGVPLIHYRRGAIRLRYESAADEQAG